MKKHYKKIFISILTLFFLGGILLVPSGKALAYSNGDLIKKKGGTTVYYIYKGRKKPIPSLDVFKSKGFKWHQVKELKPSVVDSIKTGPFVTYKHGTLLKTYGNPAVYVIRSGHKCLIPSARVFNTHNFKWRNIKTIRTKKLNKIPSGQTLRSSTRRKEKKTNPQNGWLIRIKGGSIVYLVQNNHKRPILNLDVFRRRGYSWSQVKDLSASIVKSIPTGKLLVYKDGTLLQAKGSSAVYVIKNQKKRVFPCVEIFIGLGYKWRNIKTKRGKALNNIPTGPPMGAGVDNFTKITSNRNFVVKERSRKLATVRKGVEVLIGYNNGVYTVIIPSKNKSFTTDDFIRLYSPYGGIMTVKSYDKKYHYNQFRREIQVRYNDGKTWVINKLRLGGYLKGMIEAGDNTDKHDDPLTYQKTMTIIARSYAGYYVEEGGRHPGQPFHLKNSRYGNGADQVYAGHKAEKTNQTKAVKETKNKFLVDTSGDNPSASSIRNILVAPYSHGGWVKEPDKKTCRQHNGYPISKHKCLRTIKPGEREWSNDGLPHCRRAKDPHGDKNWQCGTDGNHCVGLSATGAIGYAKNGRDFKWILKHYYRNTKVASRNYNPFIKVAIYSL